MRRLTTTIAAAALAGLVLAAPASAAFGIKDAGVVFTEKDGTLATQAGSHPYAMSTTIDFNTRVDPKLGVVPDGSPKDVIADLPPGFAVDPNAVPRCSNADFLKPIDGTQEPTCPPETAVGVIQIREGGLITGDLTPVYNLNPPPGVPSKLAFRLLGVSAVIEGGVREEGSRNLFATVNNISQAEPVTGSKLTLWGNPADPSHDDERGVCLNNGGSCEIEIDERPFITLPRSCGVTLVSVFQIDSWQLPGAYTPPTEADAEAMDGCPKLGFSPTLGAQNTSKAADSPSGLEFNLDIDDEGLTNPKGYAQSDIKKVTFTLPEGFSPNPSIAEGLGVCSQDELKRESVFTAPGEGCPQSSKIGSVEIETPLLDQPLGGSVYAAAPFANPFDSLLAFYMVIRNQDKGVMVKQAIKVESDPRTGQLTTVAEDLPQLPFSHFTLHLREGARAPLATPQGCATYTAQGVLTPWSGGAPLPASPTLQINSSCPSSPPPLRPDFEAGSISNAAGKYSSFYLRISRQDGEQQLERFTVKPPPGLVGKLAGIPFCPDASIAAAKGRSGAEELASPSCPGASQVGRTLAGAGVGPDLTYVPGSLYLAGPYQGALLSVVAITPAKVGPFDLGTVVIRQPLRVNPNSAEVTVDSSSSDPLPTILKGIPVHTRDIRVFVDRKDFILNPTNCKPMASTASVFGTAGALANTSSRFQAADCASLGFGPKLALTLKGGTKRGATPKLKAVLTYPKGSYANISGAQVTLPHSEFLEQAHIKTICTRVQFSAGNTPGEKCPPGSVYGKARATSPLLDEELRGPVFLRSSSNPLPDMVIALHGKKIDVNVVGRIDSVKGQIRNTFESVPDVPATKFVLELQGGKKSLLVNSTNICRGKHRAKALFKAHNGRKHLFHPELKSTGCGKGSKGKK